MTQRMSITTVASRDGGKTVEKMLVKAEAEQGLALHKGIGMHKSTWSITHINTGRTITWFHTRSMALGCMIELGYTLNWWEYTDADKNNPKIAEIIVPIVTRWKALENKNRGEVSDEA